MRYLLLIPALAWSIVSYAQVPPIIESKTVKHYPFDVANLNVQITDRAYLGYVANPNRLFVTNTNRDTLQLIPQLDNDTSGFTIRTIHRISGGYMVGGIINGASNDFAGTNYHYGTTTPTGTTKTWDAALVRYNDTFGVEWVQAYGGTNQDYINYASETTDGGYIFCGYTTSNDGDLAGIKNYGNNDNYWITKIDSIGNIQWMKTYGGSRRVPNPALGIYSAFTVLQLKDGNYLVTGSNASFDGDVDSAKGHNDIWTLKLDTLGNILWQKNYGGSNREFPSGGAKELSDSSIVIYGHTISTDGDILNPSLGANGNQQFWILKIAPTDGSIIWEKSLGSQAAGANNTLPQVNNGSGQFNKMDEMPDGNLVFYGQVANAADLPNYLPPASASLFDIYLFKLNAATGNIMWHRLFGGSMVDAVDGIKANADGTISVWGASNSIDGDLDTLITSGPKSTDLLTGVQVNWYFKLAACPAFADAPDITICKGTSYTFGSQIITTAGVYYDTLVSAISCDSIVKLVVTVDSIAAPAITAAGNTLGTGTYASYQWLDGSRNPISGATAQTYDATTSGNYRVVVTGTNGCTDTSAVYNHTATGINEPALFSSMRLYPNPANDVVYIQIPQLKGKAMATINTLDGRVLYNEQWTMINGQLAIGQLAPGVYFIKISTEEGIAVRKIVKK